MSRRRGFHWALLASVAIHVIAFFTVPMSGRVGESRDYVVNQVAKTAVDFVRIVKPPPPVKIKPAPKQTRQVRRQVRRRRPARRRPRPKREIVEKQPDSVEEKAPEPEPERVLPEPEQQPAPEPLPKPEPVIVEKDRPTLAVLPPEPVRAEAPTVQPSAKPEPVVIQPRSVGADALVPDPKLPPAQANTSTRPRDPTPASNVEKSALAMLPPGPAPRSKTPSSVGAQSSHETNAPVPVQTSALPAAPQLTKLPTGGSSIATTPDPASSQPSQAVLIASAKPTARMSAAPMLPGTPGGPAGPPQGFPGLVPGGATSPVPLAAAAAQGRENPSAGLPMRNLAAARGFPVAAVRDEPGASAAQPATGSRTASPGRAGAGAGAAPAPRATPTGGREGDEPSGRRGPVQLAMRGDGSGRDSGAPSIPHGSGSGRRGAPASTATPGPAGDRPGFGGAKSAPRMGSPGSAIAIAGLPGAEPGAGMPWDTPGKPLLIASYRDGRGALALGGPPPGTGLLGRGGGVGEFGASPEPAGGGPGDGWGRKSSASGRAGAGSGPPGQPAGTGGDGDEKPGGQPGTGKALMVSVGPGDASWGDGGTGLAALIGKSTGNPGTGTSGLGELGPGVSPWTESGKLVPGVGGPLGLAAAGPGALETPTLAGIPGGAMGAAPGGSPLVFTVPAGPGTGLGVPGLPGGLPGAAGWPGSADPRLASLYGPGVQGPGLTLPGGEFDANKASPMWAWQTINAPSSTQPGGLPGTPGAGLTGALAAGTPEGAGGLGSPGGLALRLASALFGPGGPGLPRLPSGAAPRIIPGLPGQGPLGTDAASASAGMKSAPAGLYVGVTGSFDMPMGVTTSDYEADAQGMRNLLSEVRKRTNVHVTVHERFVPLTGDGIKHTPIIHVRGHRPFSFTPEERKVLKEYVEGGGTIFGEDSHGPFGECFRREMKKIFGDVPRELPGDHELYRAYYVLDRVPEGDMGERYPLEGISMGDRLGVIFSRNDYGDCWEGTGGWVKPGSREPAFQIGTNIYVYVVAHSKRQAGKTAPSPDAPAPNGR